MNLSSRHFPIAISAGVLALVLACLLLPLPREWQSGWRAEWLNRMHVPLMAVACVAAFATLRPARVSRAAGLALAAGGALALAAGAELIQPWFHRTCNAEDFGWGALGVAAGTLWNVAGRLRPVAAWCAVAALLALASPVLWLTQVAHARRVADEIFPALVASSGRDAAILWTIEQTPDPASAATPKAGADSLAPPEHGTLILERDAQHGTSAHLDSRGRDWSAFAGLEFEGTLESAAPVELGVRLDLDDAAHTRLRTSAWLPPGTQSIHIPWPIGASPPRNVRQLVLFVEAGTPVARVRLEYLRLAPARPVIR